MLRSIVLIVMFEESESTEANHIAVVYLIKVPWSCHSSKNNDDDNERCPQQHVQDSTRGVSRD